LQPRRIDAGAAFINPEPVIYALGETSYYPAAIFCRQRFSAGAFGHIVYGEAEYYHDWDHGLEDVYKWRSANAGKNWREQAGDPPMYYPTHSTSMIISVTGARMTHVSCQGFVDREPDTVYNPRVNIWKNAFSNESALFRISDGSSAPINEFWLLRDQLHVRQSQNLSISAALGRSEPKSVSAALRAF
jgi:hypothetical protein